MDELARVSAVLALVTVNAFFVVGEYAVVTARRAALEARAEGGSGGAAVALRLMDDPVSVISTVQVGITAVGILTGAIGEPLVRDLIGDGVPGWASFLLAFAVVTYLSVVLGELVPKTVTLDNPERLAILVAPPIALIGVVFRPVATLLRASARVILRPFGIHEVVAGEGVRSSEELRALVGEAEDAGVIPSEQEELLHRVFDFSARQAADAMVPKSGIAWIDASASIDEALSLFADTGHRRLPVGEGSVDHQAGILHAHDLLRADRSGHSGDVAALAREALVVPESKPLDTLLLELRERREQMAIVLGEYGETAGIVTMEDIVEEIVGEIESEYDPPAGDLRRRGPGRFDVSGALPVEDFNAAAGTDLPRTGGRTLAGLVLELLGRAARAQDAVECDSVGLRVTEVDGQRIVRLEVTLPPPGGSAADR